MRDRDRLALGLVVVASACGRLDFDPSTCAPPAVAAIGVATADAMTCVQLDDATLACWGSGASGELGDGAATTRLEPSSPLGLGAVSWVALGGAHACAIAGGRLACWGRNHTGQLGVGDLVDRDTPTTVPLDGMVGVSAGGMNTCAWNAAGASWCWGQVNSTPTLQSAAPLATGLPPVVDLAMSSAGGVRSASHGCAAVADGTVWCFGADTAGQLGDGVATGNMVTNSPPVHVLDVANAVAVAAGDAHSCVLIAGGDVWCWGAGGAGQRGDGRFDRSSIAVHVDGLADAVELRAHGDTTCARTSNGDVWCWGDNTRGQASAARVDVVPTPERVVVPTATAIAVGGGHACAVSAAGAVWCWGGDDAGQRGDTVAPYRVAAVVVPGLADVDQIASSTGDVTCAHRGDDSIWCWGDNHSGQLGDGTTDDRTGPVRAMIEATAVSAGSQHACARTPDGSAWCWGGNSTQQVDATADSIVPAPMRIAEITEPVDLVGAGGEHSCAVTTSGSVWCWGLDAEGQTGRPMAPTQLQPPTASLFPVAASLAVGGEHTCALTGAGELWCSGRNNEGQIGNNNCALDAQMPVPVAQFASPQAAAGARHTCVAAGGVLECWGDDASGQLGDGGTQNRCAPHALALSSIVEVRLGRAHSCVRDSQGTVWCWGDNSSGQLGDGTLTSSTSPVIASELVGAVELALGGLHTCARMPDGTVRCIGADARGQLGDTAPRPVAPAPAALSCPRP